MNTRRRSDVAVFDREAVAELVVWVRSRESGHGISQPTVSRLMNRALAAISGATYERLFAAVARHDASGERLVSLQDATSPPNGFDTWAAYDNWMQWCWTNFLHPGNAYWRPRKQRIDEVTDAGVAEKEFVIIDAGMTAKGIAALRYANYLGLLHRLDGLAVGGFLERNLSRWRKHLDLDEQGHRLSLARLQILRPLLNGPESGFVERSWEEMTDGEITVVVKAGIAQQDVLLRRPTFRVRARTVAAGAVKTPIRRRSR